MPTGTGAKTVMIERMSMPNTYQPGVTVLQACALVSHQTECKAICTASQMPTLESCFSVQYHNAHVLRALCAHGVHSCVYRAHTSVHSLHLRAQCVYVRLTCHTFIVNMCARAFVACFLGRLNGTIELVSFASSVCIIVRVLSIPKILPSIQHENKHILSNVVPVEQLPPRMRPNEQGALQTHTHNRKK
jgi:hypothetical protein